MKSTYIIAAALVVALQPHAEAGNWIFKVKGGGVTPKGTGAGVTQGAAVSEDRVAPGFANRIPNAIGEVRTENALVGRNRLDQVGRNGRLPELSGSGEYTVGPPSARGRLEPVTPQTQHRHRLVPVRPQTQHQRRDDGRPLNPVSDLTRNGDWRAMPMTEDFQPLKMFPQPGAHRPPTDSPDAPIVNSGEVPQGTGQAYLTDPVNGTWTYVDGDGSVTMKCGACPSREARIVQGATQGDWSFPEVTPPLGVRPQTQLQYAVPNTRLRFVVPQRRHKLRTVTAGNSVGFEAVAAEHM